MTTTAGRLIEVDCGEQSTTYAWSPLDELTAVDDEVQEVLYAYDASAGRRHAMTARPFG
ncbi:MAG TPA: hypothetical protein VFY69_11670 [Solirubrobacterales bacterium]|nr:hypothetical protein [Solirubrobacterales bacterium]